MVAVRARLVAGLATVSLVTATMLVAAEVAEAAPPAGPVFSWGLNGHGQLGDGTQNSHSVPTPVCAVGTSAPCSTKLSQAVALDAGDEDTSVAALSDGSAIAWGENSGGAVGDGTTTSRFAPVRVCAVGQSAPCAAFLTGVTSVASGGGHVVALLSDGTVVAWGDNSAGQLGDSSTSSRTVPVRVCAVGQPVPCAAFLTGVTAVGAGDNHSAAVLADGSMVAWGANAFGGLGDGSTIDRTTPVRVCAVGENAPCATFLADIVSVGSGTHDHTLALTSAGAVYSWGRNGNGELGDGTQIQRSTPVRVCAVGQSWPCSAFLTGIAVAGGSDDYSLALATNGEVYSWGNNVVGQLGDGTTTRRLSPVKVCAAGQTAPCSAFLTGATAITAGSDHSLALVSGGNAYGWGYNAFGQLGDGTTSTRSVPARVCAVGQTAPCTNFLSGAVAIAAGGDHSLVIGSPPVADIAVQLTARSGLLNPTITYTVRATNRGPGTVTSGTITVRLSPATAGFSSSTCTYNSGTQTATCPIGQLANGATATRTIQASFGLLTVGLPLSATATRTASTPADPNPRNDSASANCTAITSLIISC